MEGQVIVEKLFTEVTPWVGKDLCTPFCGHITVLYVSPELINVINSLLPNKYRTAF